jgi:tetratricopeptide (TPR) repeat protein
LKVERVVLNALVIEYGFAPNASRAGKSRLRCTRLHRVVKSSLVRSQSSRPRTAAPESDLTPPEEIRARRIRRFVFLGAVVVCALGVAIYFAAPPIGGAIKAWQSRRLARQAFAMIDQKKWSEANAKARDAYLLRPTEPESWRAIARLASRRGQGTAVLEWWKKVDEAHRLTIEDRRDYAASALAAGELVVAAPQVDLLLSQKGGPAPLDLLLAAQLAARRQNGVLALDYTERATTDPRAKPNELLAGAVLVLSMTKPNSPPYSKAWESIVKLARDPANPASLDALVFLARQQSRAPSRFPGEETPFSRDVRAAPQPETTMGPLDVADALEKHPDARPSHQLLALGLHAQHDPPLASQYVADAVERFRSGDDETIAALAAWLNSVARADKTLEVLPLDRALRGRDLFLQHVNALAALERWNEVKEILNSERFPLEPVFQHMYLAVARTRLGETTAATGEWHRALEAANTPEKLLALAGYAEQNHVNDVADRAYSEAIRLAPKNRAAYAGRLRVALASDHTTEAQTIAGEIVKIWPDDAAARNQDDYLRLLLGASGSGAEAAERQAQILVAQEPWNWSARATLGLARLRLGRNADALAVFRNVRVTAAEPPGALAVRAAILAVNGYEEGARGDAHNLGAEHLLPEERALIAPLLQ